MTLFNKGFIYCPCIPDIPYGNIIQALKFNYNMKIEKNKTYKFKIKKIGDGHYIFLDNFVIDTANDKLILLDITKFISNDSLIDKCLEQGFVIAKIQEIFPSDKLVQIIPETIK